MNTRFLVMLFPFLAMTTPRPTAAQSITSPYQFVDGRQTVRIFVGHAQTGRGSLGFGPHNANYIGARYGIRLGGPFQLEGTVGYMPSQRTVVDTTFVDDKRRVVGTADASLLMVLLGIRFDLTGPRTYHNLMPYLVMGGGLAANLSGGASIEEDLPPDVRFDFGSPLAGQFGGGIEWYMTQRFSVAADARNVLWKLKTPTAFLLGEAGRDIAQSQWTQNFLGSVSLAFHF